MTTSLEIDPHNSLFKLASDLVIQSSRNIFLTGKAGTGKTTFLKYIREICPKQTAVVAPTGVAAINAGGVTIHSFLQLPFSPFIPETGFSKDPNTLNRNSLLSRLRINTEKKKILQQLELLIIDEVSMVRCDLLDAMDAVLRFVRKNTMEKFGGVQVLFIGDMFQLPPVVKQEEWKLLSEFYDSPYFFDSKVLKEAPPVYIEFNRIYRQSEERFVGLLNQIRNNELDDEGSAILESRYSPSHIRKKDDGYIVLTTHNEKARNINLQELNQLDGPVYTYEASIDDEFPENAYPADHSLSLKTGAQVMFIRNDSSERGKRYFNGKIGKVSRLENDKIFVACQGEEEEIEVNREKWENIRYSFNKSSRLLDEEVLGSFSQFPLRLAWAITIHKSQGLTFDKAIIDAGEAFSPGQVYVALSRCTSLDGLLLKSRLSHNSFFTDPRIVAFSKRSVPKDRLQIELEAARIQYLEKTLISVFDFSSFFQTASDIYSLVTEHKTSFSANADSYVEKCRDKIKAIQDTAIKFQGWLREQFRKEPDMSVLHSRVKNAADYFIKEIEPLLKDLQGSEVSTSNKEYAIEYNETFKEIFAGLAAKRHFYEGCKENLDIEAWYKRKKSFICPAFYINAFKSRSTAKDELPHPDLYTRLKKLRDAISIRKSLPSYLVAGNNSLYELTRYLPHTPEELLNISGFGEARVEKFGKDFLDIILEYSGENNLVSLVHEKSALKLRRERARTKKKKTDTYSESFKMFQQGLPVAEIAKARGLASGTIETHLVRFVESGEINIDLLVDAVKQDKIRSAIGDGTGHSVTAIRQKLGEEISYNEIRWVVAAMRLNQSGT